MKTWMITGCSSGLGHALAEAVLAKGDNAVITARNADRLKDLSEKYPKTALAVSMDVTSVDSIKEAVAKAIDTFGQVDVLINNAGYGYRSSIEEGEEDSVSVLFNTNFFGPVNLIKNILPHMRKAHSGTIINISSIAALRSAIGSGYYAASKAALDLMSDGLSKELHPLGIRVIIVEPGAFRTNFFGSSLQGTHKKIDDYAETAGKNRVENIVNHADQPGNPARGAQVLIQAAEMEKPPRRLLLGSDAVKMALKEYERRIEEVHTWESLSCQSDFQDGDLA